MRFATVVIVCAAVVPATPLSAQEAPDAAPVIEHLECPAEIDLSSEVFRERRPTTDRLAHLRFCGMDEVRIPEVQLNWNPAALDVRFEVVAPPDTDIEIRLGARVFAVTGLEISSQSRTFEVKAGKTRRVSLRLSRSTQWLLEHGHHLQLVVFHISPT